MTATFHLTRKVMPPANPNTLRWKKLEKAIDSDWSSAYTVALAKDLLAHQPKNGPVWYLLGSALIEIARYREARSALKHSLKLVRKNFHCHPLRMMGSLYDQAGDFELAKQWYRRAIRAAPDNAIGYIFLGGLFSRQGRFVQAEKVLRQAIKCTDGSIDEAFLNLGFNLRAQDRLKEALVCFQRAISIDPHYSLAKHAIRDVRATLRFQRSRSKLK
jgi:tetratricopeptide (TPR) repeat protein